VLVDGLKGGSGEAFDWHRLEPPHGSGRNGWILAGGLRPDNVAAAVRAARPTAVDVSSGVTGPDNLKKDAGAVRAFFEAVADADAAAAARQQASQY
jgi:phosphoribosylanthranilate isomerase